MQPQRLLVLPAVTLVLVAASAARSDARGEAIRAQQPRVVYVTDYIGCSSTFAQLLCDGFVSAVRRTGVAGSVVTPTLREDLTDTLDLLARRQDLVITFGYPNWVGTAEVAGRHPRVHFALMDLSRNAAKHPSRNLQGVRFRTSEAAYLAGWLAGRLERRRPGRDVVGVVAGVKFPAVDDFVVGFRAGARRASPGIEVLVAYSNDFVDASKCTAIARNQVAKGAGVLFNDAGACGLGTLDVAKEAGIWGIGVDEDQSVLGPHVLTSVVKRFDVGFLTLLRQLKAGRIQTGRDTVLTLRDGAVGLGKISPKVPASLRGELERLRRRIVAGEIHVPEAIASPSPG